jgi:hypothetical protein
VGSHSTASISAPSYSNSGSISSRNSEPNTGATRPANRKDNILSHDQVTGPRTGGGVKNESFPESHRKGDEDRERELVDAGFRKSKDDAHTMPKRQAGEPDGPHSVAASPKPCDKEPCPASPVTDGGIRRAICEAGPCMLCPPGSSPGKYGTCATKSSHTAGAPSSPPAPSVVRHNAPLIVAALPARRQISSLACEPNCALFTTEAAGITAQLRMLRLDEDVACGQNPASHACLSAQAAHQAKLLEYSALLAQTPIRCQALMPSYGSLL